MNRAARTLVLPLIMRLKASDPRDYVYGMLVLYNQAIKVDYNKSASYVFTLLLKILLTKYMNNLA